VLHLTQDDRDLQALEEQYTRLSDQYSQAQVARHTNSAAIPRVPSFSFSGSMALLSMSAAAPLTRDALEDPEARELKRLQMERVLLTRTRSDPLCTLRHVTLHVPPGSLTLVMGPIGSGKSSLIQALLGEMNLRRGEVHMPRKIAYTAQQVGICVCCLSVRVRMRACMYVCVCMQVYVGSFTALCSSVLCSFPACFSNAFFRAHVMYVCRCVCACTCAVSCVLRS